jgi:CPA2 family monovalent cation:H+ antiporter-2
MHGEFPIVLNITIALIVALAGGLAARWLRLPAIIGYLVAGVVIGPFTPGFVGDHHTISQLAELGVVFLLFGVGLHFSLKDLWNARKVAIPGAIIQMIAATSVMVLVAMAWGWSFQAGLLMGLSISIASTVVLLRNLMDSNLLHTSHGQLAVAWLIMEDIATVLILVLLPAFAAKSDDSLVLNGFIAISKAVAFCVIMLIVGVRVLPWFLKQVAQYHSRELFIVTVMVITLGSSVAAALIFDVSIALGAFIAGVVVGESALKHQVEAEVLSFREIFAVLFFVSVGMLVNPYDFVNRIGDIIIISLIIIVGKFIITLLTALPLTKNGRSSLTMSVALSQIGEFSFLLGSAGVALGILSQEQYSLLLAGALISILVNPFLFKALPRIETSMRKFNRLWNMIDRRSMPHLASVQSLADHIVVIGYGRVGKHIVGTLRELDLPMLVIEFDVSRLKLLDEIGVPYLYGDASNSDILHHASLEKAKAVIITLPDEVGAAIAVRFAHSVSPNIPIIARTSSHKGAKTLIKYGAQKVVYPELVGAVELMRQSLLTLGFEPDEIEPFVEAIRNEYQVVFD